MTPKAVTLKAGWTVLDGPGIDGLLSALKEDSSVEFTLLPLEAKNLRRKFRLKAKVRGVESQTTSDGTRGRLWRVTVEFISNRRFRLTDPSPVALDFYTSGYGERWGDRGGIVWDATPDSERLWVARGDGAIVRGLHYGNQQILGNIRDLPQSKN